jgi:hypothetical protein
MGLFDSDIHDLTEISCDLFRTLPEHNKNIYLVEFERKTSKDIKVTNKSQRKQRNDRMPKNMSNNIPKTD